VAPAATQLAANMQRREIRKGKEIEGDATSETENIDYE